MIAIGIVVALVPALGFPALWEDSFVVFAGVMIIVLSLLEWQLGGLVRREHSVDVALDTLDSTEEDVEDNIVENENENESEIDTEEKKVEWTWSGDSSHPTMSS